MNFSHGKFRQSDFLCQQRISYDTLNYMESSRKRSFIYDNEISFVHDDEKSVGILIKTNIYISNRAVCVFEENENELKKSHKKIEKGE
jgi:hypothetical protein